MEQGFPETLSDKDRLQLMLRLGRTRLAHCLHQVRVLANETRSRVRSGVMCEWRKAMIDYYKTVAEAVAGVLLIPDAELSATLNEIRFLSGPYLQES